MRQYVSETTNPGTIAVIGTTSFTNRRVYTGPDDNGTTLSSAEILVLDNASKDGSPAMIRQNHPSIKLTASFENTGFSKGNNLIMKEVKTPYILLLNSDCYLEEESLYKALAYFRVNKNCDALGARLNYSTGNLQPSAGNLPNPLNIIFWILGLNE